VADQPKRAGCHLSALRQCHCIGRAAGPSCRFWSDDLDGDIAHSNERTAAEQSRSEPFPYDRTFRAIQVATKLENGGTAIGVSVVAFRDAWAAYGVDTSDGAQPMLTPEALKVGGRYNWKSQPERLIYTGMCEPRNGRWHQFEKVDEPGVVWCEVLDSDLHMLEATSGVLAVRGETARDQPPRQPTEAHP
jgi:hypothetical protein